MDVDRIDTELKNKRIIKSINLLIWYYFEIVFYYVLKILVRILYLFIFVCSILLSLAIRILMGIYL